MTLMHSRKSALGSLTLLLCSFASAAEAAEAALDYLVLDSSKPGPNLLVVASTGGAGSDVLRQLQNVKPESGRLVLVHSASLGESGTSWKPDAWKNAPDLITIENLSEQSHTLVLREDDEAHAYDKRFYGDTVIGDGEGAASILESLRKLPADVAGKDWLALQNDAKDRRIIVTTNNRVDMPSGLRPALREREMRTAVFALLRHLKMMENSETELRLFPSTSPTRIRVAVYDGPGALNSIGRGPAWLRARLARNEDMLPELVGVPEILNGALNHADAIVMGGGMATPQVNGLGKDGRDTIVRFVKKGGGYLGICAGGCVGSNGSGKWNHLELLPVEIGATHLNCKTPLVWNDHPGGSSRVEDADLSGGPTFKIMNPESDEITVWASFKRNEVHPENGEIQLMGSPAILSGLHGKGRVVLTSTHNERPPSPANIFPDMVRWTAGKSSVNSSEQ